MKYLIHLLWISIVIKCMSETNGLPIVDKGVFVITGVKTCQNGLGYCILGNDCTVDKEFVLDTLGGHCDGLRKAFTPRTFFTCCAYNDLNLTTTTSTTTLRTTTLIANDMSLESNETSDSVESNESTETLPGDLLKPPGGVITINDLLQNGTTLELDKPPEHSTRRPPFPVQALSTTTQIVQTESTTIEPETKPTEPIPEVETTSEHATSEQPEVVPNTQVPELGQSQIVSEPAQGEPEAQQVPVSEVPEVQQVPVSEIPESPAVPELEQVPLQNTPEPGPVQDQSIPEVEQSKPEAQEISIQNASAVSQEQHKPSNVNSEFELPPVGEYVPEYVQSADNDTNLVELKTSPAPTLAPPVQEIISNPDGITSISNPEPEIDEYYGSCGVPQIKQKEIRVATADSNEMNEQVGGDVGSCWLGGLVRSPTSLFSINDPGSYICSGALISENIFLTSATCISRLIGNDLKLFRIILGTKHIIHPSNGVTYNGIYREIVNYKIHANYSVVGQLRFNDIGIIELKSRTLLEAFRHDEYQYCTLCLPRQHTNFDKCIVSGYSHPSPSNGQDSDGIVHEAEQYIESSKYCESIINTQKINQNYDGFTCASGVSNGEACFSPRDAGSPLACNVKNTSKYFIAGIFSSGFHCGTHDAPVIYTNIKQYLSWIYQSV